MAEEAAAADNNVQRDYWIGGVRGEDGTWRWQSGDPMDYTNWNEYGGNGDFAQLLRNDLASYGWWASSKDDPDSGVICEMSLTEV